MLIRVCSLDAKGGLRQFSVDFGGLGPVRLELCAPLGGTTAWAVEHIAGLPVSVLCA